MAVIMRLVKKLRIYVDTSVMGGCVDEEFQEESLALLEMAKRGELVLIVSALLMDELEGAPEKVQKLLDVLPGESCESIVLTEEALELRDAYIASDVVTASHRNDATHVALATVSKADMIVSWNFKHIVHYDKIRGFNAVNLREGYMPIEIHTPKEVV